MSISVTEENYLKAIFSVAQQPETRVGNQLIAEHLAINPASVTEMLRKLDDKGLRVLKGFRFTITPLNSGIYLQVDVCSRVVQAKNLL